MTNRCPFCTNYAYAVSVGDAYQMDCRYCDIQVEITKRAYAARCPDPVGVLEYIREKMKMSTRPRVDLADMKRLRQPPAPSQESSQEEDMTKKTSADSDALTTAAKAIGTTLGKIAVKTGIAKPTGRRGEGLRRRPLRKRRRRHPRQLPESKRRLLPRSRPRSRRAASQRGSASRRNSGRGPGSRCCQCCVFRNT